MKPVVNIVCAANKGGRKHWRRLATWRIAPGARIENAPGAPGLVGYDATPSESGDVLIYRSYTFECAEHGTDTVNAEVLAKAHRDAQRNGRADVEVYPTRHRRDPPL